MLTSQRTRPGVRDVQERPQVIDVGYPRDLWNMTLRGIRFASCGIAAALILATGLTLQAQQSSRYEASRIPVTRTGGGVYHAVGPGPQPRRTSGRCATAPKSRHDRSTAD